MVVYVPGIVGVLIFYLAVFAVGIWAATTKRKKNRNGQQDYLILANRQLGLVLGAFTLTATWVGPFFLDTTEMMYEFGLAWCQLPIGMSLSLLFGGLLFAKPMRKAEYVTMLDPFQQRYGARIGGLLFIPALLGDVFWCSVALRTLGYSAAYIADLDPAVGVLTSSLLVATYTICGGLYSIAYTDALKLICIMVGLTVTACYVVLKPAPGQDERTLISPRETWIGEIKKSNLGLWTDELLRFAFGGIPWQGYFQRILSTKSPSLVRTLSIASMFGCTAIAVPAAMIGFVARSTDWTLFNEGSYILPPEPGNAFLSVLVFLTPPWISFLGLGSIAAAAMSFADSCILSSSSMFARNIYRLAIRPKASEKELDWILRISVLTISLLSAGIALKVRSVILLAILCWDMVYVVLFPQLLSVIHWPSLVDTYGCLAGYFVAVALRISGGCPLVGIDPLIHFPYYEPETGLQKIPFLTSVMMTSLFTQLFVSLVTRNLLGRGYCPSCCDLLGVYSPGKSKEQSGVVHNSSGAALIDATLNETSTCHGSSGTPDEDSVDHCSRESDAADNYHSVDEQNTNSGSAVHKANRSLQNIQNLQNSMNTPGRVRPSVPLMPSVHADGQILGVRNLENCVAPLPIHPINDSHVSSYQIPLRIGNPNSGSVSLMGTPSYGKLTNFEKIREIDRVADRSSLELNLNLNNSEGPGVVKKNVMGVKLIGMEGGTLRRPSLQGTFSPTPSVELVNILDRRQSAGSYGPSSLSPVPGVEACKTHGTAVGGQSGNENCRIKRGIVRHHSFNDTGDRSLTTLARQPNYPSMPLRAEDCRLTLVKREKKPNGTIARHSSVADEKALCGRGLVLSPTYSMYGSAAKNGYFVADDEAVSRF